MTIPSGLSDRAKIFTRRLRRMLFAGRALGATPRSRGRLFTRLAREEDGGPLIEIALTVPVLLGLVTGICTFGIAFSNQLSLTQAVGSAGQYLAQIRTSSTDPCADAFKALKNAAPNLTSSKISMTVILNGSTPTQSSNSCSGSQTSLVQGTPVTVYATYPCTLAIYGVNLGSSCQLSAKVTEYEY